MSAYVPSASVSHRTEDGHCLLCLTRLAGTLTVMTTILQLSTGNWVKTILYTTKDPTYKSWNKTNHGLQAINVSTTNHTCAEYLPPFRKQDRTNHKTNKQHQASTARYLQLTSSSIIKNIQLSSKWSVTKRKVTAVAIKRRLRKHRPLQ